MSDRLQNKKKENTTETSVVDMLRCKTGKPLSMFARRLGVSRKSIYDAASGDGSRRVRVSIAQTLKISPSVIWPKNPKLRNVCDDVKYMESSKWII